MQAPWKIELTNLIILKILSKHYKNVSITEIITKNDLKKLALRKPDLVFSGVKYFYFADGIIWLNDYLELHDILYIASNRTALHNEHDKSIAKKIVQKANIRTADFFTTEPGEHQNEKSIPISFPLFIKPLTGGDSRGVDANSIVYDFLSFQEKELDIKRKHNLRSLVETYLSGKEYSVSILQNHSNENLKAMPIEIVVKKNINGHRILDYDIKENDHEKVIKVLADLLNLEGFDFTDSSQIADEALSLTHSISEIEVPISNSEMPNVTTVWQYTPYARDVVVRHASSLQQTQIGQMSEASVCKATAKLLKLSEGDLYKGDPVNINESVAEGCVFVHTHLPRQFGVV